MKPYYSTENVTIYHGDAWRILKRLPVNRFKLVILDPPYVEYRDRRTRSQKWKTERNWSEFYKRLYAVMEKNGVAMLFGLPSYFMDYGGAITRYFKVAFDMVWVKPIPISYITAKVKPLMRHEIIVALIKRDASIENITYNWREIGGVGKAYSIHRKGYDPYSGAFRASTVSSGYRYPTTVLEFPNKPAMKKIERTGHPTQKPISLIDFLVRGWSNEGDYVLDPFLGSGSTAIVCEVLNRKCVGIEIMEKYCKLSIERLKNARKLYREAVDKTYYSEIQQTLF